jgi:hypothetical protein
VLSVGRWSLVVGRWSLVVRRLCYLQNRIVDIGPDAKLFPWPGACLLPSQPCTLAPKWKCFSHTQTQTNKDWPDSFKLQLQWHHENILKLSFFNGIVQSMQSRVDKVEIKFGNWSLTRDAFQRPIPECRSSVTHARY